MKKASISLLEELPVLSYRVVCSQGPITLQYFGKEYYDAANSYLDAMRRQYPELDFDLLAVINV